MAKHEYYVVQGKTLNNIAETMKTVLGVDKDTPIRFDEITNNEKAEQVTENVDAQAQVIEQIKTALNGKSSIGVKEIMDIIDQSGVLDSTEGTATEKVEQLIDKAELEEFFRTQQTGLCMRYNGTVEETPIIDCTNYPNLQESFMGCYTQLAPYKYSGLKTIRVKNTHNTTCWIRTFYNCRALETLETLDFSSVVVQNVYQLSDTFRECGQLKNIKIVSESLKVAISFLYSKLLTAESIQSIIDGLATVETAQTLTLHADVKAKLTETQLATITSKNWNLA